MEKAFKAIPKSVVTRVVHHNHAIIYYEAYKGFLRRVEVLPRSVFHHEPSSLREV